MSPAPTRRRLMAGSAAVTATVAVSGLLESPASAATTSTAATTAATAPSYPVNPFTATAVPTATELHYLNRLGCGFSRAAFADLRAAGGAKGWFEQQLAPESLTESAQAAGLDAWFPDLTEPMTAKIAKNTAGTKKAWDYARDLANLSMLKRTYSRRQVFESMVDFWSNHLHVKADLDYVWAYRADYDRVIRTHSLGRFEDMLLEASLHPAMLLYLDNWRSVKNAANENQGRELLELHTVGRASGYTEAMVKDAAKLLSGYTVDVTKNLAGYYDPAKHTTGPVQVLGFTDANAAADGRELTRTFLRYLANHPATARTIALKLARHYVSDSPSTGLVDALAKTFRESGTDIKATLRTLVAHPDFLASAGGLTRSPIEDSIATARVLEVTANAPKDLTSFANSMVWMPVSTLPFQWPRPDGSPYGDVAWASAARMLLSFKMHWNLAAGWYPAVDATYRAPASWLPQPKIRLDQYVDHLSRSVLGRPSTTRVVSAAIAAVGYPPSTIITKDHPLSTWLFVRLASVLLDSPDHMRR